MSSFGKADNRKLEAIVNAKVNEVKLNVGVYQKPRAALSTLMENIASDPVIKMGIGFFTISSLIKS